MFPFVQTKTLTGRIPASVGRKRASCNSWEASLSQDSRTLFLPTEWADCTYLGKHCR